MHSGQRDAHSVFLVSLKGDSLGSGGSFAGLFEGGREPW